MFKSTALRADGSLMRRQQADRDGFSLVELLVVIVILGILSAVVVFAVRAITDRGEQASCATDARVLSGAQEAHWAANGNYVSENDLVTAAYLRRDSELHDVLLLADDYEIVGVGACVASPAASTSSSPGPSIVPTSAPGVAVATSWGPFAALRYGTGPLTVLITSAGDGMSQAVSDWEEALTMPLPEEVTVYFVDTTSVPTPYPSALMLALLAPSPNVVVWGSSTATLFDTGGTANDWLTANYPAAQLCIDTGPAPFSCAGGPPSLD